MTDVITLRIPALLQIIGKVTALRRVVKQKRLLAFCANHAKSVLILEEYIFSNPSLYIQNELITGELNRLGLIDSNKDGALRYNQMTRFGQDVFNFVQQQRIEHLDPTFPTSLATRAR